MLLRETNAIFAPIVPREVDGLRVLEPRRRKLVLGFVARGQIEERAGGGVEAVAFGELGARLAHLSFGDELSALAGQPLGARHLRTPRLPPSPRRTANEGA